MKDVNVLFADLKLERTGRIPLNEQLYRALKERILTRMRPDDRLPPSRELAKRLGVGRVTVSTAYTRLTEEGYLESRPGFGTYVSVTRPERKAESWRGSVAEEGTQAPAPLGARALRAAEAVRFRVQAPEPLAVIAPDYESLPGRKWTQIVARVSKSPWMHNGYGEPGGYMPYRQAIADYVRVTRGIVCEAEQVVATCGIQQGLDLCARVLFNPGDVVAVEDPGFEPHRLALEFADLRTIPIGVDAEGLSVGELRMRASDARGVLVTPSHQYPLGCLMTLGRREALLEWARSEGGWIIEDDYDSELRYGGAPTPALASLDASLDNTVYLGSFTKMIYPGFKLGYMVVPKRAADAFAGAKCLVDRHVSEVHQAILTEFVAGGGYDAHIRRLKNLYDGRRRAAIRSVGRWCADYGHLSLANHGTHLTFLFDIPRDDAAFCETVRKEFRIELRPLSACYRTCAPQSGLILGFAGFSEAEIEVAVARLGRAMKELLG